MMAHTSLKHFRSRHRTRPGEPDLSWVVEGQRTDHGGSRPHDELSEVDPTRTSQHFDSPSTPRAPGEFVAKL
jgi:hypothetical protein